MTVDYAKPTAAHPGPWSMNTCALVYRTPQPRTVPTERQARGTPAHTAFGAGKTTFPRSCPTSWV